METVRHHMLPNFLDLLLDTVFVVDLEGQIVYVSAACERMFGYTQSEMIGKTMIDLVAPEDRERTLQEAAHVIAGQARIGFENRYVRKDGSLVHLMWSARWSPADRCRVGVARDVTEHKRMEDMQAATYAVSEAAHEASDLEDLSREIHRIIATRMSAAGFAIAVCHPDTRRLDVIYRAGLPGDSAALHAIANHVSWEPPAHAVAQSALRDTASPDVEGSRLIIPLVAQQKAVGVLVLQSEAGLAYSDRDRELLQFVSAQIASAVERKQLNAELLRLSRYDDLTGLPNRRLFHHRIRSALADCQRRQGRMAVLFVDLDNFKCVNDCHGHDVGDLLLQECASRLDRCVGQGAAVFRLGGDEFVVLLPAMRQPEDASVLAEAIRGALSTSTHVGGLVLQTGASIGIATYPEDGDGVEALLKRADRTMYEDKQLAGSRRLAEAVRA